MAFVRLAAPFWLTGKNTKVIRQTLALIVLTVLQIVVAVEITQWTASLFNALEQRSMPGLMTQIGRLALIFAANMIITTFHLMVKRSLTIGWRSWFTKLVIGKWMDKGYHFQITHLAGDHDNPDSRIADDVRIATEDAITLGHSLFYCVLMLGSYTQILWSLSGVITTNWHNIEFHIHGHLVWLAIVYAAGASTLVWWIGKPLTKATNYKQSVEANFRFGLVKARENSQAIALIYGEKNEQQRFGKLFDDIVFAYQQQTKAWVYITLFTSGYSVLSMAFPVLISAPRFIIGAITLGTLMQSAQAFQQMAAALSWPVDNMASVANWRASVERVLSLVGSLDALEKQDTLASKRRIVVTKAEESVLSFYNLCIEKPNGEIIASNVNAKIKLGEKVLISADATTGAKLFKVIAGLWHWGSGYVELPDGDPMFFMPPSPYLPSGTLLSAICYPRAVEEFDIELVKESLVLAGLPSLFSQLDQVDNWDDALSQEIHQRLGLVRLLIYKPKWILLQESLDSLDPNSENNMLELICKQLPDASLLTVTNHCTLNSYCATLHDRWITL
jgi:putative ATP-binding cassette transporter